MSLARTPPALRGVCCHLEEEAADERHGGPASYAPLRIRALAESQLLVGMFCLWTQTRKDVLWQTGGWQELRAEPTQKRPCHAIHHQITGPSPHLRG